jgi:glycosyltransferase involved in cell wall biosynthesis
LTFFSIVIPSFNSGAYLSSTFKNLTEALSRSALNVEVIVVDDGSTDDTSLVLEQISQQFPFPLQVIKQENKGRFIARWEGIRSAKSDKVLLLDSRVLVDENSFLFIENDSIFVNHKGVFNGYVVTDPKSHLAGFFWDVPTRLFWGHFLRSPQRVSFGIKDFDRFPKGTGFFLAPKEILIASYRKVWPEGDVQLISDDTRLLRDIAQKTNIIIDPAFRATYRPRISFSSFLSHTFDRGTLFVDSYAGTSVFRALFILLMALSPMVFLFLVICGLWQLAIAALGLAIAMPAIFSLFMKTPWKSIVSFVVLIVPFGLVFWAGLIRGIYIHRSHFLFSTKGKQ